MPRTSVSLRAEVLLAVLGLAMLPGLASAQAVATFDFEDQPVGEETQQLVLKHKKLTIAINRPGSIFDVAYRDGFPPEWGTQALSPFLVALADPYPFVIDLSAPASRIVIDAGDFGGDTDVIRLTAFDGPGGTGNIVGETRAYLPVPNFPFSYETLMVEGRGIQSFAVFGGSSLWPNSVFFDNLRVELDKGKGSKGGGRNR